MLLGKRGVEATFKSNLFYKTLDPRYVPYGNISKEFDSRKHWSKCKTIGEVHNDENSNLSWVNIRIYLRKHCITVETNNE